MSINEEVYLFKGSLVHEFKNASFLRVSRFTFEKGEKQ